MGYTVQELLDQTTAYKKTLEDQAAAHQAEVDKNFGVVKSVLNSVQKNFEDGMNNNSRVTTGITTTNIVRDTKYSPLPFIITGLILIYLYSKGKLKI